MPSFDEASFGALPSMGGGGSNGNARGRVSRIIGAEELSGYVPFAMKEFKSPPKGAARASAGAGGNASQRAASNAGGASSGGGRRASEHGASATGAAAGASVEADGTGAVGTAGSADPTQAIDSGPSQDNAAFAEGYRAGRDAGADDGFKRGFEAGLAHADQQQRMAEIQAGATLISRVDALSRALQQRFDEIERQSADDMVGLALEVARQALRTTLAVRPESILAIVQEALGNLLDDRTRIHLFLNPADAALVRSELGERLTAQNCEIVPDPSVEIGGCRVTTPRAEVDATMETRWRRTLSAIGRNADGSVAVIAEAMA